MSTISIPHARHGTQTRHGRPLRCGSCRRDVHQIIEPPGPADTDVVEVSCTCIECGSFYAGAAAVPPVARILNRSATVPGVLQFGGEYIHCGDPMKTQGADVRSIYAPMHTDRPSAGLLEVYLRTKVLHCGCGFQMEIPQEEGTGGRRAG
ncbi:MAG TPA: hypothetical protein VIM40_03115 [Arthrobacter sp.]|jgi:hypothetical protein